MRLEVRSKRVSPETCSGKDCGQVSRLLLIKNISLNKIEIKTYKRQIFTSIIVNKTREKEKKK